MRSGPGLTYEVTGSLSKGDEVDILSASGDWLYVQFGNKTGWVAQWLTAPKNETSGNIHGSLSSEQLKCSF